MTKVEFKDIRNSMGVSQVKLSAALGLSRGHISDIERGIWPVSPCIERLMQILDAVGYGRVMEIQKGSAQ